MIQSHPTYHFENQVNGTAYVDVNENVEVQNCLSHTDAHRRTQTHTDTHRHTQTHTHTHTTQTQTQTHMHNHTLVRQIYLQMNAFSAVPIQTVFPTNGV